MILLSLPAHDSSLNTSSPDTSHITLCDCCLKRSVLMYSKGTDRGGRTMGLVTAETIVSYSTGFGGAHQNTQDTTDNKKRIRY